MADSWWDDFSNNLATDLAPLIALFGESPTKQYLSECLTAEDIVIFAVAPLGVITAVVSAIRVRGTPSLRAFVGRAQEGAGIAEAELCSSTSRDVCELYSNGGIARVFGRPKLLEVVHDPHAAPRQEFYSTNGSEATASLYSFKDYTEKGRGKQEWNLRQSSSKRRRKSSQPDDLSHHQQPPALFAPNPNLSLNIGIKPLAQSWFIAAAIFGCLLQFFVLLWAILTRYHYHWIRNSREDEYAVPLTVIGTIFLCLGVGLCARLIESKTIEQVYQRAENQHARKLSRMYWIQPGNQIIGDQVFGSFAYSDSKDPLKRYITSRKDERTNYSAVQIWGAVGTTALGFISQFLGLRACHSSVAVVQLGVTLLMSLVRASLRAQRLREEDNFMWASPDFFQGHELDCLALKIGQPYVPSKTKTTPSKEPIGFEDSYLVEIRSRCTWTIFTAPRSTDVQVAANVSANTSPSPDTDGEDKLSILERIKEVSEGPPILSGFRIKILPNNRPLYSCAGLVNEADKELLSWISTKYCDNHRTKHDCTVGQCEGRPNRAAKIFFYRSRLARMTGSDEPESERSSYWGKKFVPVRDTALILAHTIEDTMQILFASDSEPPVTLYESWEYAFRIFWTVQCSLLDPLPNEHQDDSIHMSLRREIDKDGIPQGPWKSNRSELEAVLGLWLWSLKEPRKRQDGEESDSKRFGQQISRILSANRSPKNAVNETLGLDIWRERGGVKIQKKRLKVKWADKPKFRVPKSGDSCDSTVTGFAWEKTINCPPAQNAVWWRDGEDFVTSPDGPHNDSYDRRRFFGWCNLGEGPPCDYIDVLEITSENSLLLNCAQEIYSIFLTAIMGAVKTIGGRIDTRQHQDGFAVSNENVDKIRRALVQRGLCDAEDAFACVIPILGRLGKLELSGTTLSLAGSLVEQYRRDNNWEKVREVADWIVDWSYSGVDSKRKQSEQDSATGLEATNTLRLSVVNACESYRRAILQDGDDPKKAGCEGIIALLERFAENEIIMSTPAVWVDCGVVPDEPNLRRRQLSLADIIRSYGEAIMWCINSESSLSVQEQQLLRSRLKKYITEPRVAPDNLFCAINDEDLSSTLYLLQRHRLNEPENTRALFLACRLGWYMVVEVLIELGAGMHYVEFDKGNALSHASSLGDINTARVLMRNNAALKDKGRDEDKYRGPLHYAAKQGHALILKDLIEKYNVEKVLDEDQDGITPLAWGIRSGNSAAVEALANTIHEYDLSDYYIKEPPLHLAIKEQQGELVDVLLKIPAVDQNSNHSHAVDSPPLICAIRLKYESIFEKILKGARVDADRIDTNFRTALWWAAALGLDTYVEKLLDSGKVHEPDMRDRNSDSALSIAVEMGHLEVVRQLLRIQEPASVSLKSIFIAAKKDHMQIVEELLPHRVKDKNRAEQLLQDYGLGEVWRGIQTSKTWAAMDENAETHVDYKAEIGELSEEELEHASRVTGEEFHIFKHER
ncbi:putative ankyrin repeat protein [Xylaria telfairii]|nr:putative ankyrin repeat protein [Xylaria telfairii]